MGRCLKDEAVEARDSMACFPGTLACQLVAGIRS